MPKELRSAVSGYAVAAVSFGAALAFSYIIRAPRLPEYAYIFLYLIAVLVAAWKGGFGPGILASLGTLILVPYLFSPSFSLQKI
jgi:K+-sensing histidine kinase KdpD